ncbi:DEAD/DEAH box helicase, partial [Aquabacterium sp.]|uniref:DEAD/DEAH box helicase n=1 Tax=Aquabacterium sp. TaxID=1872578 RepID=UPI0035AFE082
MTVNKLTNSPSSEEPLDPASSGLSAGGVVYRLRVAVDAPQHSGIGAPLDYLCERTLTPGALTRAPFGRRTVTGVVWHGASDGTVAEAALKPVAEVWAELPPLPASWLRLVEFTAGYYQRGIGEVALSVLPPELRQLDGTQLARRLKRLQRELDKEGQDASVDAGTPADAWPEPSPEQAAALTALAAPQPEGAAPRVTLLHGATGSGKTEVYLREVQRVLDAGRQALVLVPEINLTPQLHGRFAARFGSRRVVALHSGLTPAQRLQHWLRAHLGHADVVLGTRLAVFTPLPRLGLVVVDEEHEPSYKQQEGARYSARDLAVMRGRIEGVPVILGSATPSIETWHNAQPASEGGAGRYQRLGMPARIGGGGMPTVRLLDMSRLPKTSA